MFIVYALCITVVGLWLARPETYHTPTESHTNITTSIGNETTMKPSNVALAIEASALLNIPLFIWGPPGTAKSSSVLRAASALAGRYGFLFLDELPIAPAQVQGCLMQLVLDGRVGEYKLPYGWRIIAAGNRKNDRGVFHRPPDPLIDRFIHVDMESDLREWCDWALAPHTVSRETVYPDNFSDFRAALRESVDIMGVPYIDNGVTRYALPAGMPLSPIGPEVEPTVRVVRPETVAFARFRPALLHSHDSNRECLAFATQRGWADVSAIGDLMELEPRFSEIEPDLIRGRVGDAQAGEYMAFLKLFRSMISPDAVIHNPLTVAVPENAGVLYALAEALARRASAANFDRVLAFAGRMPREYAQCLVSSATRITPALCNTADYIRWCSKQK